MVPLSFLLMLLAEDRSLPHPDRVCGFVDDLSDPRGFPPLLEELLADPNVRAVVEAADGLVPAY